MVFPSVPVYLDPHNWNQQPQQSGISNYGGGASEAAAATQLPLGAVAQPPRAPEGSMPSSTPARPSSMAERARLAKVVQSDQPALNCPRCDSANTKFCYYNNYSLTQPRHFCKTCRRYWTRGGALRNVPVGGGFRRNKRRTKPASNSKPSSTAKSSGTTSMTLPFMGSVHGGNLSDHVSAPNLGLSFSEIPQLGFEFPVSSASSQQFPFLGGMELPPPPPPPPMYHLDMEGSGSHGGGNSTFGIGQNTVNMEENQQRLGLLRQYFGIQQSHSMWGGANAGGSSGGGDGGWPADLAGFNNSSGGNML